MCGYSRYRLHFFVVGVTRISFEHPLGCILKPSSGSLYRLFVRFSFFIIASVLAGEYGIVTVTSIGILRLGEGGKK